MGRFVKVASVGDVPPGSAKLAEVEDKQIALFNLGGAFYAIDNACTHAGASLAEGTIEENQVICPWHGANFDLQSGQALTPPAPEGVAVYKVRVQDSDVEIEL